MRFPELTISGTPAERGYAHGFALSAEIEETIDYYATIFKKPSADIIEQAKHFRNVIQEYNPAFCREIEGIAAGANLREPLWIYALNSRSEILSLEPAVNLNECTALCFSSPALLGQNWDWGRRLEKLTVLMQIQFSDDHKIQMLTEPGIIGKIGLNSSGIGVCLNILLIDKPLNGVPVHILLRSILESRNIAGARKAILKAGFGKASNILFGDKSGKFNYIEFAGDESFTRKSRSHFMIHTNHYLEREINPDEGDFRNSYARYRNANEIASSIKKFTIKEMISILSDRSNREFPIWRTYQPDADLGETGTVASIIMDLKTQKLYVRKGNIQSRGNSTNSKAGKKSEDCISDDFGLAFKRSS